MSVNTLIAAAFLSLATGFVLAFPAGVVMSDAGVMVDGGRIALYTFEAYHEGTGSCRPGVSPDGDYTWFNHRDSNVTVGL